MRPCARVYRTEPEYGLRGRVSRGVEHPYTHTLEDDLSRQQNHSSHWNRENEAGEPYGADLGVTRQYGPKDDCRKGCDLW